MYLKNSIRIGNHQLHTCQEILNFLFNPNLPTNSVPSGTNSFWDNFDMCNKITRQTENLRTAYSLQDIIDAEIALAELDSLENIKYAPYTSTGNSILNSFILDYKERPSLVIETFHQYLNHCNAWENLHTLPDTEFQQYNLTTHQINNLCNGKAETRRSGGRRTTLSNFFFNNESFL